MAPARGGLVVMANAKKSIACTKEGTNRCAMGPDHCSEFSLAQQHPELVLKQYRW